MSEEEELQEAVDRAEAEARALDGHVEAITLQRRQLSFGSILELTLKQGNLTSEVETLLSEEQSLNLERSRLRQELYGARPQFPRLSVPITWLLRSARSPSTWGEFSPRSSPR